MAFTWKKEGHNLVLRCGKETMGCVWEDGIGNWFYSQDLGGFPAFGCHGRRTSAKKALIAYALEELKKKEKRGFLWVLTSPNGRVDRYRTVEEAEEAARGWLKGEADPSKEYVISKITAFHTNHKVEEIKW